jgi:Lrp/AsnC family transcriptional regulator
MTMKPAPQTEWIDRVEGLDGHDVAILGVLQEDADLPVAQVAERVQLSPNACWRRIKGLEEDGFIARRVALLDPRKLRAGVTVIVTLRAAEHSEDWAESLAAIVRQTPEVVETYRMSGASDYLLKILVEDVAAYDRIYKRLSRAVRLGDVTSAFVMEEIKRTTAIPLPGRG